MIRWAFDVTKWEPAEDEFNRCLSLLPQEERDKTRRFHFPIDAKRAVVGQLLARASLLEFLPKGTQWSEIGILRTEHGKPYLVSPKISGLLFNISHHGNWVVVAAGFATQLGVDVARVEKPEGESYEDFFAIFQSYFSSKEWMRIKGDSERSLDERQNHERLHRFYHHWCLKESYVKALGLGLGLDLDRIEFSFRYSHEVSPKSMLKRVCDEITISQDRQMQQGYKFELSYLDDAHPVAVCYLHGDTDNQQTDPAVDTDDTDDRCFRIITWRELHSRIWQ